MYDFRTAAAGVLALAGVFAIGPADAQTTDDEGISYEAFLASLSPQHGTVTLPGGIATINLPESFYYLTPADTARVLTEAWGNPPGGEYLGMLVPSQYTVLDQQAWAAILHYEEDGHVKDDDARDLDYDELLGEMREGVDASNVHRADAGFEAVSLVGWALRPHYDAETKKMYWAKELKFGDAEVNTLNYDVRILGRKGVLVLSMVAGMPQLEEVAAATPTVLAMTDFTTGNRYADFDPELDEVAAYGVGALIAGKVAAKAGLFAKLGILLVALKKFWIVLVIGAWVLLKRVFSRR